MLNVECGHSTFNIQTPKEFRMPRSFTVERENMPPVVQGWLRAVGLGDEELVELIFTDQEILLRRPISPELRSWAKGVADSYDKAFRQIAGLT
jgi:hypothetical protein